MTFFLDILPNMGVLKGFRERQGRESVFYKQKNARGCNFTPRTPSRGVRLHPPSVTAGGVPSPSKPSGGGCTYNLRAVSVGYRPMIMAMPIFKTLWFVANQKPHQISSLFTLPCSVHCCAWWWCLHMRYQDITWSLYFSFYLLLNTDRVAIHNFCSLYDTNVKSKCFRTW